MSFATEKEANQFYAVESLPGIETENANDLLRTIREADVGQDAAEVLAVREAYRLGYMGARNSDLRSSDASILNHQLQDRIYGIGQQQRKAVALAKPVAAAPVTVQPSNGYKKVVFEGKQPKLNKKRSAEVAFVDYIAENFSGTNVHVYESYKKADGKYYYKDSSGAEHRAPNGKYVNGEIWLDLNAGDNGEGLMLNTFAHEMYHHVEKWNKAKAQELTEFVVRELGLESVDKAVTQQIEKARASGLGESYFQSQGMTEEQARNEVYTRAMSDFIADSLETMFTRGDAAGAIAKLKNENRGLLDEIRKFVDKWVSKLKKFYADKTISQEGEMVAQLETFEKLQQLFMEAMQGAGENYRAAQIEGAKNTAQESGESDDLFSIRQTRKMSLKEQLSLFYKKGFKRSDAFYFGEIPAILHKSGLDSAPLAMGQDDFLKSTRNKHNIPRRVLLSLNANLGKPIFSFTAGKQAAVVIDDIDGDGKPVVVAIHGGHNMDRKAINLLKSIYGIDSMKDWLKDQIDGGSRFKIYDIEKTIALLQTEGYLAEVGAEDDGFWDKITQVEPDVKIESGELLSERNYDRVTARDVLAKIDVTSRKLESEKDHLRRYQDRLKQLETKEHQLKAKKAEIEESQRKSSNRAAVQMLKSEARIIERSMDNLKKEILFLQLTSFFLWNTMEM